jgi:hypothetical protein
MHLMVLQLQYLMDGFVTLQVPSFTSATGAMFA